MVPKSKSQVILFNLLTILIVSLLLVGCSSGGERKQTEKENTGKKTVVYTTIYPLYDFATNICGERAEVVQLVPDGVEPHDWEPSPRDMVNLKQANVFVYNGAGLESWVQKVLRNLPDDGPVTVDCSAGIELLPVNADTLTDEHDTEIEGHHEHDTGVDPHIWLDPVNAQIMVDNILLGLQRVGPDNSNYYNDNARTYQTRLKELHKKYEQTLAGAKQREFIVSHAAFGYLARRYNLEQLAIRGISPEADPSPARMTEIINIAKESGVKHIFFETLISPRVSEVIAQESGATILVLNPLGGITSQERQSGKDYLDIMEENLRNLSLALGVAVHGN